MKNEYGLEQVSIRLVPQMPIFSAQKITTAKDAVYVLGKELCDLDKEAVYIINLRSDKTPINCSLISIGTIDSSIIHPREILKSAILSNANSMIMIHNHPSGRLIPSKDDIQVTDRLIQVCQLIGIPLLDHIIVGGNNSQYYSMKEQDLIQIPAIYYRTENSELEFHMSVAAENTL